MMNKTKQMITRTYHQNLKIKIKHQKLCKTRNESILICLLFMIYNEIFLFLHLNHHLCLKVSFRWYITIPCNESVRHAQNKENYSCKLELHDLNTFIAIVLISGYDNLPRCPMFWECSADIHNDVAFSVMSKNRFDEIMKYLHLAVNTYWQMKDSAKYNIYWINWRNSVFPSTSLSKQ